MAHLARMKPCGSSPAPLFARPWHSAVDDCRGRACLPSRLLAYRHIKRVIRPPEMSASLSGRVGVKRFSDCSVDPVWDVHSQGARFSSGSALGPSHDGITRMRRTNLRRRPCRKTSGRHKDSKRTRLIHRPCGDIAPPVGGIRVFSCCFLLCTTRCEILERHKCALTARALLFARSR
jgi:hypothetical protein